MEVLAKTGKLEVLTSGQVLVLANEESSITIGNSTGQLKLSFIFKEDDKKEPRMESAIRDKKELFITFWNFNHSLGQGNIAPIEFGTIPEGKVLYSYRISSLENKTLRTFEYTFYLERP